MVMTMLIMNASTSKFKRKAQFSGYLIFSALLWGSCAYRLTNLHTASPNNIKPIYVEAVYDTGAETIPHEQLWDELQRAFAANGQLRIAPASEADAVLRAHIVKTQITKAGERKVETTKRQHKDPDVFAGQNPPPTPGQLRDISIADDYFLKSAWSSTVRVEVWDLKTRKLLLQREYPLSGEVLDVRGDQRAQIHHVRHEESLNYSFRNAARGTAGRIVSDLTVR